MRLTLLFLLLPFFVQAQRIQQLTKNNHFDAEVDIYKNRIVWQSGHITDWNNEYTEIFLGDGTSIRQITSSKQVNILPKVGEKYIVWSQLERYTNSNFLMCYDGVKTFCLDTLDQTFYYNTVNKYILWHNRPENKQYFYNGDEVLPFVDTNGKPAFGGRITEEGIFYTYWHDSVNYLALFNNSGQHEIIDSAKYMGVSYDTDIENFRWGKSKQARKTLVYQIFDSTRKNYQQIFLVNGVKYIQKDFTDSVNIFYATPVFSGKDFQAYQLRDSNGSKFKIKLVVFRNGKYYDVSEYPFEEVKYNDELKDITFPFRYINEIGSQIGIFSKNRIYLPTFGNDNNHAVSYGNSVAWVGNPERKTFRQTSEIYYFCDEDSCITAKPTENFNLKIFHRNNAKQIALEVETPQAENFVASVYDLLGREITSLNFTSLYGKNIQTISSEFLQQGIYLVRLQNVSKPEQQLTQKLFIPN